jgi:hypothetical protein
MMIVTETEIATEIVIAIDMVEIAIEAETAETAFTTVTEDADATEMVTAEPRLSLTINPSWARFMMAVYQLSRTSAPS